MELVNPTAYAASRNVSKQAIHKAIKIGKIPVYDDGGRRVDAAFTGKKFVKPAEADRARGEARVRVDIDADDPVQIETGSPSESPPAEPATQPRDGTLTKARTETESYKAHLLRMELDQRRGNLLPKEAVLLAFERGGGLIAQDIQAIVAHADEITAAALSGGADAVRRVLHARVAAIRVGVAERLKLAAMNDVALDDEDEDELS